MIVSDAFRGRRYAVLGLARSGIATVDALVASGAHVLAWDSREEARAAVAGKADLADPMDADLTGFEGVVVSPGIPLNRHPIKARAASFDVPVIGDVELFARARGTLPRHKVVGITGTNGKSTTTALIAHMLRTADMPVVMGGNIGLPILSRDPLPEGGVYVLELSSYQIDLTCSLDCDVAILLNITPDHLDRYDGFADYCDSKARLFEMQSPVHTRIVAADDDATRAIARSLPEVHVVSWQDIVAVEQEAWPALRGPHNAQNVAVARAAARALGLHEDVIDSALCSFASLPHRMQTVAERDGVLYVNDSKATNPASAAPALSAFPPRDGRPRVHWILGGQAKGDSLDECVEGLPNVKHAYTIGEAGELFAGLVEGKVPVDRSGDLRTAVRHAARDARPGDVVLLSPAAASFDQFRDFEARGDAFAAAVADLDQRGAGHEDGG